MALAMEVFVHEEEEVDHPVRYLPLGDEVYPYGISPFPTVSSSTRYLRSFQWYLPHISVSPSYLLPYLKKPRPAMVGQSPSDSLAQRLESRPDLAGDWEGNEMERGDGDRLDLETDLVGEGKNVKKRNTMKYELLWLGDGYGSLSGVSGPRLRGIGGFNKTNVAKTKKRVRDAPKDPSGMGKGKRWVELDFEGAADPQTFVG